ncbi:hypothetical protein KSF_086930 [Reticulibacter mediterranei]|uniref:Protein kinase domain-containing protein n=1 Tax=Reticulibacter mediterranei TaxID=2778369 RepID=A0A8J3IUA3_9CHLR|nr:serine/threonine-protein kinase [Reticulibacter mediterranei]GHO98645.1 hypothetical protein KSF_086930 [Reticulibacter mediterranei]
MKNKWKRKEDSAPSVWKTGDCILGEYDVTGIVGEGGMGIIYKIYHRTWRRDLVVKSPKPEIFAREDGKENFIREAETWANLREHPHLVRCYLVSIIGGIPRIFADYIEGGSLAEWIRQRRLYQGGPERALERMLDIAIQFAWGLHAAHEQGLVHQDVKPANVLLTSEGIAKVTDFGLARARVIAGQQQSGQELVQQSILISSRGMTPAYCSPEQATGQKLGRKTDIWSWGLSVFQMFTGEVTWRSGVTAREALARYKGMHPGIPEMPAELRNLLNRCFELHPEKRPATMLEVAMKLQAIYAHCVGHLYARDMPKFAEIRVNTLINRGCSLAELGRLEEALLTFEQAIYLDFNDATAYYYAGHALRDLERFKEALLAYEQAIRLDPNDPRAYFSKGGVLERLGRAEEALLAYEQAIRLDPNDPRVYYNKGGVLGQLGKAEEALLALEQAIRLDPNDADAYYYKGSVLRQLGRFKEAEQAEQKRRELSH